MDIEKLNSLLNKNNLQFENYYNFLIEYNKKVNLTAITERQEVFIKHFLDSILPVDEIKNNASVIDVGAGAGFPGLPLKIVRNDIKLTMVDSLDKRVKFLKDLSNLLDLKVECVHARAEDFCKLKREKFDVAVARAVAPLNTLVEYLLPLTKIGGIVLAYKGSNFEEELNVSQNAIKILGGKYLKTIKFDLPNNMGERNIIVIEKISATPAQFPRGQNKPKLQPIK